MGDWTVDGRDGVKVTAVEQMMGLFLVRVYEKSKELQLILDSDPLAFEQIEQQAKELFDHGAGLFLTGLIAKSMKTPEHEKRCDAIRDGYVVPLRAGQDRQVHINMASGFSCHAKTRYCQPKHKNENDHTPGIDIELSLFGFSVGKLWQNAIGTRRLAKPRSLQRDTSPGNIHGNLARTKGFQNLCS